MTEQIEVEVREEDCSGVSMWSVCINRRHVWRFETSRDATRLAVSIQRALRAATPKEPDVKQEFKPGDLVRCKEFSGDGTVVAVKDLWVWVDCTEHGPSTYRANELTLAQPDPYEAAATQVACKMNLRNFDLGTIADILRSHFPAYAEMRAVVEAARSCRNFMDPDDYTDLQDALDALAAKEADRG